MEGPGRRSFFKYASPQAAKSILESRVLRLQSPLAFNDPFDLSVDLTLDISEEELHRVVLDRLEVLASSPERPEVDIDDPWGEVVAGVWDRCRTVGGSPREISQILRRCMDGLAGEIESTRRDYLSWWESKAPDIRVLCVSEERDNLLMWAHYAQDHTGVVLELLSLPEDDNALSAAVKVEYVDSPLPFFTSSEWVDDILSVKRIDPTALYLRYPTIKSRHWEYEKEWRVWYPRSTPSQLPYDELKINSRDLKAVYIGCRASDEFCRNIERLVHSGFPGTKVYVALKKHGTFGLEFKEI